MQDHHKIMVPLGLPPRHGKTAQLFEEEREERYEIEPDNRHTRRKWAKLDRQECKRLKRECANE